MFRAIILPIFKNIRLCYNWGYNARTMLPAGGRPATSWVHYTTSCNTQSNVLEDGQNNCPKHVALTGIINKPLLMHLVGCLYYLYFIIIFFRLSKQSQFIPLQNVVYFIMLSFLVRKIFTFCIIDVLLFNCPITGPKG
jgi:hypothetical protein